MLNLPYAIFAIECCFSYKRSGSALLIRNFKLVLTQLPCNIIYV